MSSVRILVGTRKGAFILTSDGKRERWNVSGPLFAGWEIYHLKGSPVDPERIYCSQSSGWFGQIIQRSDDGGKTWHQPGTPAGEPMTTPEGFPKAESNKFVYDTSPPSGKPLTTHQWYDGTQHPWEFKRVWHLEPSLTDPETIFAGVEDAAIFKSTDGGKNWHELAGLRGHGTGPQWAPGAGGMGLHTRGNIDGYLRASGPKKLRMSGVPNAWAAAAEFSSVEFHKNVLLPFYDHYLKGKSTDYLARPNVQYQVRGANVMRSAESWPPPGITYMRWFLNAATSGSVTSLNDGGLSPQAASGPPSTTYKYPVPGWVAGVVGFGPSGPAGGFDPVRRVLTFTTTPLDRDLEISGPIKLVLYASSSACDTDFFIKLSDQFPQAPEDRGKGLNPFAELITRGWLRASHRALDPKHSTEMVPYHTHNDPRPLTPNEIYNFEISLEPMAYLIQKGHRLRLEIVNGDSPISEQLWPHYYRPDKVGSDTIHHDAAHPSELILPISPA